MEEIPNHFARAPVKVVFGIDNEKNLFFGGGFTKII